MVDTVEIAANKKLIDLPHKVCPMTCMVNGLEDQYENKSGQRLPDRLFLYVSGLGCSFAYLKNKNAPIPRLVLWGKNIKQQYHALADVIGFDWEMTEDRSFGFSLERAKQYIDRGSPVILGALDMFYLPYYSRFYRKIHIPYHYVMMVGYDQSRELILVHDCDRLEIQEIPYSELESAWNVYMPGVSRRNTLFKFDFHQEPPGVFSISREGFRRQAADMLEPPAGMFGIPGMRKLAGELAAWPGDLDDRGLTASLHFLVEFTGDPPNQPDRISGFQTPIRHAAGRDGYARLLNKLAEQYTVREWALAAETFRHSGEMFEAFTDIVVDYLLEETDSLEPAAQLLIQIVDTEEAGNRLLLEKSP